jgi:hypothetical protein
MRESQDGRVKGSRVKFHKGCECGVSGVELCGGLEVTAPHDVVCGAIIGEAKAPCRYFNIEAGQRCGVKLRHLGAKC